MTWLRRGILALALLGGVWTAPWPALSGRAADVLEIRALWVTRSSLTSAASITGLVQTAHLQGFNTLLVQVRGRADAYYASGLEPRAVRLLTSGAGVPVDQSGNVLSVTVPSVGVHEVIAIDI